MIKLTGRPSTFAATLREHALRMARRGLSRRTKLILKGALAVLVLAAVGRYVVSTLSQLSKEGRTLRVEPLWIALGVILYLAGLAAFGTFFQRVMQATRKPVSLFTALRAYIISHLGKYVPGKALVVVMRVGLVVPEGARPVTAAFATLYETLVMMAGGAVIATLGFILAPIELWPIMVALVLALAFLIVVDPRVFPRLSALISLPFKGVGPDALPAFSRRLLIEGLLCSQAGWTLLGLSQVAVVRALSPAGVSWDLWPLVIASVALATVVGFVVAPLPGGLGVRELVLMATLEPALRPEVAVPAALALRLTWVLGELLGAGLLVLARVPLARPNAP